MPLRNDCAVDSPLSTRSRQALTAGVARILHGLGHVAIKQTSSLRMVRRQDVPEALSRRGFLKLGAFSLLGLGVPWVWSGTRVKFEIGELGRVASPTVDVYRQPTFSAESTERLWRDELLDLSGAVIGDTVPEHNRVWYEVPGQGFVHSSNIQPVLNLPNEPLEFVPYSGRLMEVTVPYADSYWRPRTDAQFAYRFYFGSTHWVTGVSQDVRQEKWYRISDDKYAYTYYAPAVAFRPVPDAELAPISPLVPAAEKRIEVDLARQWVTCYENDQLVFATVVSSGRKFSDGFYWTPEGEFITFRKRGSRHMASGNRATGYDLPGVPWVSYITENGVAFHGTYWHNDFGIPRSHGCINMTPQASKWLYRWTTPVVPPSEPEVWVSYGTKVRIAI